MSSRSAVGFILMLSFGFEAAATDTEALRLTISDFAVDAALIDQMLEDGKRFYSVDLLTSEEYLSADRKAFHALEYMGQDQLADHAYLVSKHTYIVDRPANFFNCELLGDSKYISALEKEKVTQTGPLNYVLKGQKLMIYRYQFDLNWYADLPDCQNLSEQGTPAMLSGMDALRTLDADLGLEIHGTYIKDKPNFTQFLTSGWVYGKVFRLPQATGDKSLFITYEVSAMPSQYAIKRFVEGGHIEVMELEVRTNSTYSRRIRK